MKVYLLEVNLDFGIDYDDISNRAICVAKNKEVLEELVMEEQRKSMEQRVQLRLLNKAYAKVLRRK